MRSETSAALAAFFLSATAFTGPAVAERVQASFDCAKAQTPREVLACASDEARQADLGMARAYGEWMQTLPKPLATALQASQRQFNNFADRICAVEAARDPAARDAASQCLAERMAARSQFLTAIQSATVDGLAIQPMFRTAFRVHEADADERPQGWIAEDAIPVLTGAADEVQAAFRREIGRLIAPEKPLIAGRTELVGAVTRSFTVSTLSARLISLQINEHVEAGTSVPDRDLGLNFDPATGRLVTLDAIFRRDADWRRTVTEALRKDLNHPADLERRLGAVLSGGRGVIWAFGPAKVTVSWTASQPPAESVEIPAGLVARFLKPDSPWKPVTR